MYKFCVLFDRNYLYKGLTLYFSLLKNCDNFHLYILCKDEMTHTVLQKMNLSKVSLIQAVDFENNELLHVKKQRNVSEYSWTLASSLCWYMMDIIGENEMITYLDADMCFFDDPKVIFEEIGDSSIAIVEHRLRGVRKTLEKFVGKYNVGWVSFRKDKDGLSAAEWWKDRVLEWCGAYFKDGKIGDQHYLNDWLTRYNNVCVIKNEGADVAPWNVCNNKVDFVSNKIIIGDTPLIFYHFHNFILVNKTYFIYASAYHIPRLAKKYIYGKYFKNVKDTIETVDKIYPSFNYGFKKNFFKSLVANLFFRFKFVDYVYMKYSRYKLEKTFK